MEAGRDAQFERWEHGRWQLVQGAVVREALVRLHVNGQELATLMCTPVELDLLALGFLRSEGIIDTLDDVRLLQVCPNPTCVDVWLRRADFEPPVHKVHTSGCGGGVTFADLTAAAEPLMSDLQVTPRQLAELMQALHAASVVHKQTGGIHSAGLAEEGRLLLVAEDIGRHNAVDKLWGRCLVENIPTRDRILLTSGRISSEMIYKAARMGVPVVASHTSPTSLSVDLAKAWNLTLAGYVRRDSLNIYTGRERIMQHEEEQSHANS